MHRRRLARTAPLLAVALAFVATSCSGGLAGPSEVASVADRSVSRAALDEQLELERAVVRAQAGEGAGLDAALDFFDGEGRDTVPTATAAEALTTLVQLAVLEEGLERAGGEVSDADREQARTDLEGQYQAQGIDLAEIPAAYLDQQIEFQALQSAIRASIEVPADELQALYDERVGDYAQVCLSALLVET